MFLKNNAIITLLFTLLGIIQLHAQQPEQSVFPKVSLEENVLFQNDSLVMSADSIAIAPDTIVVVTDTVRRSQNALDAPVAYQAKDSILMTAGNMAYLYGEGNVKYEQIELQSEEITLSLDSSLVFAKFGLDSVGEEFGYPLFKDGDQEYEAKTMRYNFKTKKGYITDVITQQGEGYVTAGQTKKLENDDMFMLGGKYTTCDNHEHPHFYIQLTKAKVRPKKNIVTGPAYLVLEDVPLPLGLPFGFFPFSSTYSSGVIFPTFGEESARGFFLRDGGYYFALSDYIDLALTGEIYTKGSWGLQARSSYKKRYKFSGNFNIAYLITKLGDKGLPDYSKTKDFKITWTHTQDPKANPYRTFSASVNFGSTSYDRNQINNLYNYANTNNTKASTVNITQRFPNFPLSLSANMSITQRTQDSSINVTLPSLTIALTRIYPFKRKSAVGKERWYEKISFQYNGELRNSINTKDSLLFKSNLIKDWQNGMNHSIAVSSTFNVLKYLNISPTVNYRERWLTHQVHQQIDPETKRLTPRDTVWGFNRIYDYDASVSLSTTLYGVFKPLPFLGDKIQMIRHRFEPQVSISGAPDFGDPRYGYYETATYMDENGEVYMQQYSPFSGQLFSVPGQGKRGNISISVSNNLEMKVKSDRDSTGFRKISLIDNLTLGINYNMAADSFKWSDISASLRLKLSKQFTLNLNGTFDTYTYKLADNGVSGVRVDKPRWSAGKGIGRLKQTSTSFSYTFTQDTFKKWFGGKEGKDDAGSGTDAGSDTATSGTETEIEEAKSGGRLRGKKESEGDFDSEGYLINKVPWSLSFNYGMSLGYDMAKFDPRKLEYKYKITHSLGFNGNIQPTKGWRFNFNATYDFDAKKISYMNCSISRDLHCWQMSCNFIPVGPYKSYSFNISVSSSLLKDLKYDKRSTYRDSMEWY